MSRRGNPFLVLAAIGAIALIAGIGRLSSPGNNPPPDETRIRVLVAFVVFGVAVTTVTLRAIAKMFLEANPTIGRTTLSVAVAGFVLLAGIAFLAGRALGP